MEKDKLFTQHPELGATPEVAPPAMSNIDQAISIADDLLKKTEELAKSWKKPEPNPGAQPLFEMTIRQHVALSILCSMVQSQASEYPTPAMVGTSYTLADLFIHKGQS
jgi:hypothetical protein